MIDVKKEIKRYMPIDLDNIDNKSYRQDETLIEAVKGFSAVLKRIGKEQYRYSHQLEEILDLIEDLKAHESSGDILREDNRQAKKEIDLLTKAILDLADALEDIYTYAIEFGDEALKGQMAIQWDKLGTILTQYGISRMEGIGTHFTSTFYVAKAIEEDDDIPHGQIVGVIRSGYLWKGQVLRKAQVIVNRRRDRDN